MAKIGRAARGGTPGVATVVTVPAGGRGTRGAAGGGQAAGGSAASVKTHPCASCGICCRSYLVPVYGRDVWAISRALQLDPARFVVAWQEEEPSLDGFRLEQDGPLFSLVLDKRGWSRTGTACVFLLRLPGGNDRCGIYEHRPVSCRTYPMVLQQGAVALREDPLCPPDAWAAEEPRRPGWRDALQRARMELDVYRVVAARWNGRVRAGWPGRALTLEEYYGYLLEAYDRVAALDAEIGEDGMARLRAGWRAPLAADGSEGGTVRVEELPWQRYLDRVRGATEPG